MAKATKWLGPGVMLVCFSALLLWLFAIPNREHPLAYYGCLAVLGTGYAAFLEWLQRVHWRSAEYTWLEVVIGVMLTLAPANLLFQQGIIVSVERINGAFIATGGPVVLWQIIVSIGRWRELKPTTRKGNHARIATEAGVITQGERAD